VSDGVWQYFAIFGMLIAAGFGMPIPEELPVIMGGVAAGHAANQTPPGHPFWYTMLPVCYAGVILSDSILYAIGWFGGRKLLDLRWVRTRLLVPQKRAEIEDNFHKYGVRILLGARFLPGIRAPVFVMAGVLRMPLPRFVLADGLYAIPGVSLLFGLAFWFTDSFLSLYQHVEHQVALVRHLIVLLVLAAVGGAFLYAYQRRRVATGNPHELPIIGDAVAHDEPAPPPTDANPG
jgi:membrane protein DedA with SNARE-associated domain